MTTDEPTPAGILVVDKPLRITSASVVSVVKGRLKAGGAPKRIRVGHAGTLDPLATGVLVVLVGKATKLSDAVMGGRKEYLADVDLSAFSTTDDLEGDLTPVAPDHPPSRAQILNVLAERFTGVIQQRPPAYSAIKVGGRRSYRLARTDAALALPERPVTVHAIDLLAYDWPIVSLRIACGKGTYVRSLARDLGLALGTGGVLASLRRTRVGDFLIDDARTLEALPEPLTHQDLLVTDAVRALLDRS